MSLFYSEADYENSIIELFQNELDVLMESLYRLNRGLHDDAIKDAIFKLKNFENGELIQKNTLFMDYLQNGIPVRYFSDGKEFFSIVYIVDYKNPYNNSFIVSNQWTFI